MREQIFNKMTKKTKNSDLDNKETIDFEPKK
jgi:hypothetical protein